MGIRIWKNDDVAYFICADGGGDDMDNPFFTLEEAVAKINATDGEGPTDLTVWRATFVWYCRDNQLRYDGDEDDDYNPRVDWEPAVLVWERE